MSTNGARDKRVYNTAYYAANREYAKEYTANIRRRNRHWLDNFLSDKFCSMCGEAHPATLDFHHRDPSEKEKGGVSYLMRGCARIERIEAEIAKCDILCSNCHRKYHWEERRVLTN